MPDRIKIFFVSLFSGVPWLIAAGMAFSMAYQTTDPRAAEIGRAVQVSLFAGLVLAGLIGLAVGWLCLSLNRRTRRGWWSARLSLWVLLGVWGAMIVRVLSARSALPDDPGMGLNDRRLLILGVLSLITVACLVFVERRRALFDGSGPPPRDTVLT